MSTDRDQNFLCSQFQLCSYRLLSDPMGQSIECEKLFCLFLQFTDGGNIADDKKDIARLDDKVRSW